MRTIYWIDSDRFDTKLDKSTWLETGEVLVGENFSVTLLCGFRKEKYIPKGYRLKIKYFRTIDVPFLFRCSLLINIFFWLIRNIRQDDIIIVSPQDLWIAFFLKLLKKCNLHLDIRTVPVDIYSIIDRIDYLLFWKIPLTLFHKIPDSFSFITELLRQSVEREFCLRFQDFVIWHSGVNTRHFKRLEKDFAEQQSNKFVITYLGVISKNRGINLVLEALSILKKNYQENIVFQVIGNGADLANLKSISSALKINKTVNFKGYIPYEFIPKHLGNTGCFICPLPNRPEWNVSSPIKVFEYLACKKPIILTPIAAHKNIVENEDFIVWTDGDKMEDFVRAIEYAYENCNILTEAAKKAPDVVRKNYEWRVQGKRLADYLKRKYHASTTIYYLSL